MSKALDVLGERWTLLIVRDLLMGPSRYGELLERLQGVTTNLLAKRIKEMQEAGLIEAVQPGLKGSAYRLTEKGEALEEVVFALGHWGFEHAMEINPEDRPNLRWALLSARRRWKPLDREWAINITSPKNVYCFFEKEGKIRSVVGESPLANLSLAGDEAELCRLIVTGDMKNRASRNIEISGEKELLTQLLAGA
ncbi:helix-turn-helix transcriptional regulator [Puniceicoccaceae bacterium K14]|nr:helix-turn-helix transcriptional regulator [Puniceicoccaceae bacterium K14]